MKSLLALVNKFFTKGHERSLKAKKNVAFSFIIKIIQIGAGVALVPLMLSYLGDANYGVWLTIASTILWFEFFDVGLGHGLRNRLGEALAKEDFTLGRQYVSTAYAVIGILALLLAAIAIALNGAVNWSAALNAQSVSETELASVVLVVILGFSLLLIVNLVFAILFANQLPMFKNLINALSRLFVLIGMVILNYFSHGSLIHVACIFSSIPVLVALGFSVYLFTTRYRNIAPRYSDVRFGLIKNLMGIGGRFFIIQICATVVYSTDNMIISHLFSPSSVTPYEIAHKYFAMVLMVFGIVVQPMWSAVTEAYSKNELGWIKKSVKRLMQFWLLTVVGLIVMLMASPIVYEVWLSGQLEIPFILSATWALFIAVQTLNMIFSQVVNGIGKVKLQMIIAIGGAILNIPLSIYLARNLGMGVSGVITATLTTQLAAIVVVGIQYRKLVSGKLSGIWNQ